MKTLFFLITGLVYGHLITYSFMHHREIGVEPTEFSYNEKYNTNPRITEEELSQPLVPMDIKLKILSDDEFDKVKPHNNTAAFTTTGSKNRLCEIVIPVSSGNIVFNPGKMYSAHFDKRQEIERWGEMSLSHEILHCMIGHWHQ